MNNYLLLGHILACHVVPEDNIHPKLWAGAGKRFKPMPQNRKEMHQHNAVSVVLDSPPATRRTDHCIFCD